MLLMLLICWRTGSSKDLLKSNWKSTVKLISRPIWSISYRLGLSAKYWDWMKVYDFLWIPRLICPLLTWSKKQLVCLSFSECSIFKQKPCRNLSWFECRLSSITKFIRWVGLSSGHDQLRNCWYLSHLNLFLCSYTPEI